MAVEKRKLSGGKKKEIDLHKKVSSDYEKKRVSTKFTRYYQKLWADEMLDLVDIKASIILDYCCASSIMYPYINKRMKNSRYVGIDLSDDMLKIGKKKYGKNKNFKVSRQDGENLKFKEEAFDVAILRGAIHHLPDPLKGLEEVKRVLKDKGIILVSEPTSNFIIKGFRNLFYRLSSHFSSSHKSFSEKELLGMIKKTGFRIKKTKRFGLIAFPFMFPDIIPALRYFPYFFLRILVYIDTILLKVPIVNTFSWSLVISAEKIN